MNADEIRELVRRRIIATGQPLSTLSKAAGKNHSYLYQYLNVGKPRTLPESVRDLLAPLLGLNPSDLKEDVKSPGIQAVIPESNARPAPEESLPAVGHWPLNVPVLGTAEGGAGRGDFEMNGDVVDYVRRPPGVAKLKDLFAIYVIGTSMIPWRRPGEPVYCSNARRRAGVEDHVVVELHPAAPGEPCPVLVKQYRGVKGNSLLLAQYNPAKEFSIPMSQVKAITRVIDWPELVGI